MMMLFFFTQLLLSPVPASWPAGMQPQLPSCILPAPRHPVRRDERGPRPEHRVTRHRPRARFATIEEQSGHLCATDMTSSHVASTRTQRPSWDHILAHSPWASGGRCDNKERFASRSNDAAFDRRCRCFAMVAPRESGFVPDVTLGGGGPCFMLHAPLS